MTSALIGNRYTLNNQLGMGAMGAVYRATDRLTGETLALKRVLSNVENNVNLRLAIAREFHVLASLRHPNIISVQDYGFDAEQRPYITMTLLEQARDLQQAARMTDDMGKINLIIQVLQALAYLHQRNIIHRDLKPANVLVTADAVVRVLDFGLAIEVDKAKEMGGTLMYMAPEVLQMQPVSPASDLFAVGAILYEMFTEIHPFDADTTIGVMHNILMREPDMTPVPPLDVPFDIERPDLSTILGKLLAKDPRDRYNDAYTVIADLVYASAQTMPPESETIRESYLQAARFVGREKELHTLTNALTATLAGSGSRWLIGGESGIGKSRLLNELRTEAMVRGALVLRGQAVAEGGTPYQLWREPMRRIALVQPINDLDAGIIKEFVPEIGDILDRHVPSITRIDARDERRRIAATIASIFRQITVPTLLILEDIQWARESLEALELLAQQDISAPLMIVASYRTDEQPELPASLPGMTPMQLERLDASAVRELVASMLGKNGATPGVVQLLQRETEGNAYFLVETVRVLAEEAGSRSQVAGMTLPAHVLAGGVQQIVQRRLTRIPTADRPLLALAAVIGRELDLALMERIPLASTISVESWLTTCVNSGILEKWDELWRFSHDKLREGVLADISDSDRQYWHRVVAEGIEQVYPNDITRAGVLADHWKIARDSQKEATYARLAGRHALNAGRYADARDYFIRVLAHNTAPLIEVHKWLGDAWEGLANYRQAIGHYATSQQLAEHEDDPVGVASALEGIARVEDRQGDLDEAEAVFQQALTLARAHAQTQLVADCLNGLGTISSKRGSLNAAQNYFEESLTLRRSINDKRGIAASLNNLGIVAKNKNDFDHAKELYTEGLQLRKAIGDPRGVAGSLNNLAILARTMDSPKDAKAYYLEAVSMTRAIGDQHSTATILNNLGVILFEDEEFRDATRIFNEALKLGQSIGDDFVRANALQGLGRIAVEEERLPDAERAFRQSADMLQEIGNQRGYARSLSELGRTQMLMQAFAEALVPLQQASEIQQKVDVSGLTETRLTLAHIALAQGRSLEARTLLREALNALSTTRTTILTLSVLKGVAELANREGNYALAARLFGYIRQQPMLNTRLRDDIVPIEGFTRSRLTVAEYQAASAAGAQMTLSEVLAGAL